MTVGEVIERLKRHPENAPCIITLTDADGDRVGYDVTWVSDCTKWELATTYGIECAGNDDDTIVRIQGN